MEKWMYCEHCQEKIPIHRVSPRQFYKCPHCNMKNDIYVNATPWQQDFQHILRIIGWIGYTVSFVFYYVYYDFFRHYFLRSMLVLLIGWLLFATLVNTIIVALYYPPKSDP